MKTSVLAAILIALAGPALAQAPADHEQHHPGGTSAPQIQSTAPAQPQTPPAQPGTQMTTGQMPMGQMMQNMPEQCRAMMQNMPQGCMGMMQQMMQGMMGAGMAQGQGMQAPPSQGSAGQMASNRSEATKAYAAAVDKMHAPMMQAIENTDPDVAFVKGMIPHHQSAVDMAKVVLQYGKDEKTKQWAADIIREQEREIREMQAWLTAKGAE